MMTRPLIGITGSAKRGWLMWQLNRFAVWRAGGRPVRLTPGSTPELSRYDGFVIGGGDDIGADLYDGEAALTIRADPARDQLEQRVLGWAEEESRPVLGICRGAQMINIERGGSLHQDIYAVYAGLKKQRTVLPRKTVHIEAGTRLAALLNGETSRRVNVLHHQSVARLGRNLKISARDSVGMIQAIECTDRDFLLGVQWHPEFLIFDRYQQNLFRALVSAATGAAFTPQPALP